MGRGYERETSDNNYIRLSYLEATEIMETAFRLNQSGDCDKMKKEVDSGSQ
jgi:hypothetical protein